jgi:hypothetical protein
MENEVKDESIAEIEDESIEPEEAQYKYIVGIDLGTTNSAVSYVDLTIKDVGKNKIRFLDIPQLVAPGEIGQRSVLPSFLYIPGSYEMPEGSTSLPWDTDRKYAVGEIAREQGAVVPGRLVSSAKSHPKSFPGVKGRMLIRFLRWRPAPGIFCIYGKYGMRQLHGDVKDMIWKSRWSISRYLHLLMK